MFSRVLPNRDRKGVGALPKFIQRHSQLLQTLPQCPRLAPNPNPKMIRHLKERPRHNRPIVLVPKQLTKTVHRSREQARKNSSSKLQRPNFEIAPASQKLIQQHAVCIQQRARLLANTLEVLEHHYAQTLRRIDRKSVV